MPVSPARAAAFDILLRVERESSYASELLHSQAYEHLSTADHALATELVMGTLRWRSRLDDEVATASSQPLSKLDAEVLIALRLAVYQFLWLDRIPRRAALNESVELVKRARKRSAAPFVNAVLRKLSATQNGPITADDEGASPEILARVLAHPLWLVQRWADQHGLPAARQICQYNQTIPSTAIRLRTPTAEGQLHGEGISLSAGQVLASARRVESGDITKTQAFRTRQIVIQDEASQLVAALVGHGSNILDCCAAPGGKTLALADRNPSATVTAIELHSHRARLLQKLLPTHESRINIVTADAEHLPVAVPFDRVLADVPCSGTGTLARNPEIKWRLQPSHLAQLHQRQGAILRSALAQVSPGGRLIYCTCSLEKEENEDVIEQALAENSSFRLLDCGLELQRLKTVGDLTWSGPPLTRGLYLRTLPGIHPCDGFFAAMLERI
ncbi:MAG TPA: 16S rRNA (cytosine(967)-C(5))-methyltransferase RsmB [Candidatus Sulfotelmatobacter sp.]|jgi:16S rRNA (cytosine967-C5)-methyltransferase|nr:16S rRNA (cytosine(967)-C(5))-methyltransferase RsmB [Candidatus Sulfotelmatobacter sp.]